jgi:hypothetical protein
MPNGAAAEEGRIPAIVPLWDDNPSLLDLLGFDTVVTPVMAALQADDLDPITISVQAPWGGGKSTVLNLIEAASVGKPWIVVRVNPWEFDDQLDVKGTLIAQVLLKVKAGSKKDVTTQVAGLIKRISWSRVGLALARGALTMQWDPDAMLQAFNPDSPDGPQSLAEFKTDFAALLGEVKEATRVVVLVDDLDRCLPQAVLATLETIKLFLAVQKMAFVIAADQEMVRDSIAAVLAETKRSEAFAKYYLEKIVQLPVQLPKVSKQESEAYVGLLLTAKRGMAGYDALLKHCSDRRSRNMYPLLGGDMSDLICKPAEADLRLAANIANGLDSTRRGNPREIKRFLNAFGVRKTIADSRRVAVQDAALIKMMLLEQQHRDEFDYLLSRSDADRRKTLDEWEKWGRRETDEPPEGISPAARDWAGLDPALADVAIDSYLALAARLLAATTTVGLDDDGRGQVRDILNEESVVLRQSAAQAVAGRPLDDQRQIVAAILEEARRADDATPHVSALIELGSKSPDLVSEVAEVIGTRLRRSIDPANAVELASSEIPAFIDVAKSLVGDDAIGGDTREAARQSLGEGK